MCGCRGETTLVLQACDGLWLASEMALEELDLMKGKGITHIISFGKLTAVTSEVG